LIVRSSEKQLEPRSDETIETFLGSKRLERSKAVERLERLEPASVSLRAPQSRNSLDIPTEWWLIVLGIRISAH
jgi:hypothetical protein